eukprot:CAMPEP_0201592120 /NCGR_PEP_ID=MMETSP0190_2-20130828/190099_1 /ASSEMBLY_ACC=CAM_ASM_000263 /TAXON_ID=37353 /ORGANISM="Rosalina sp." /LENGTH=273 /DNA_ID=CAMNT_0048050741 /DNA_START=138 /DNA_END=956 /DNA_ORIENTATION=+
MTDDMKDIGGLNSFMFNGNINLMDMMDNGTNTNGTTTINPVNTSSTSHDHIKQENNMLPPEIGGNGHSNYALPPSTQGGYPGFSISASPPQQSPMFMDSINPNNHNIYGGLDNGHNQHHHNNNNNHNQFHDIQHGGHRNNNSSSHHTVNQFGEGLMKSRLLSTNNGANTIRPSNLPNLRRNSSAPSTQDNNTNINNLNSNISYLKHSKSDPNHNNLNNLNLSHNSNHILTPFDYPLSNPTINASSSTSDGAGNGYSHGNDGYPDDQNHFNFLW